MSESHWKIWLLFFLYPLFVGIFVQFVALPHLFPSLHAGEGLLQGGDWLYFHRLAKDLAERIRAEGWRAWELRPEGQAPAGIAAIFYLFFAPKPWVMLPFNALVHALGGIVLFFLVYDLVGERSSAFLATLPFVFFPSAMNWYAQLHKDGIFALGVLLFLWGWCMLVERKRGVFSLFAIAGGSLVVWVVRPYAVEILGFLSLVAALALSLAMLFRRRKPELWWVTLVFLWVAAFSVNGIARIEKPIGKPLTHPWSYSPWVPDFIEEKLRGLAEVREQYRFIDPEAMGNIDWEVTFHSVGDVLRYIPRAVVVGFLAPFPSDWLKEGTSPGGALKRRICGLEMVVVYLSLFFFSLTFWRYGKIPLVVVFFFAFLMLLIYALAFPNLGPLYRERYGFLMTLVALGIGGWYVGVRLGKTGKFRGVP
ncbi:hypothetical protein [Candidatus Caldatribacterium saccharofermentans]|uniref:hypothetical protein n=1 Tax=Candidatus Caldatribacterium saccharofermentans TaxID=1454753 RepID=UPI003CFC9E65